MYNVYVSIVRAFALLQFRQGEGEGGRERETEDGLLFSFENAGSCFTVHKRHCDARQTDKKKWHPKTTPFSREKTLKVKKKK